MSYDTHLRYPGIWRACFAITLDNGGLNCDRPEEQIKAEFGEFIKAADGSTIGEMDLVAIDAWLLALNEDDMETVTAGEVSEADALLASAPAGTQTLLGEYFEEVC